MPSQRAVHVRDRLNELISSIDGDDDQERHILRCCIAVAVEEIEKWMYGGNYTPSVMPVNQAVMDAVNAVGTGRLGVVDFDLEFSLWPADEKQFFRESKKIQFIKAVRARTSCELKVGKDYWERMEKRYPNLCGSFSGVAASSSSSSSS